MVRAQHSWEDFGVPNLGSAEHEGAKHETEQRCFIDIAATSTA